MTTLTIIVGIGTLYTANKGDSYKYHIYIYTYIVIVIAIYILFIEKSLDKIQQKFMVSFIFTFFGSC